MSDPSKPSPAVAPTKPANKPLKDLQSVAPTLANSLECSAAGQREKSEAGKLKEKAA